MPRQCVLVTFVRCSRHLTTLSQLSTQPLLQHHHHPHPVATPYRLRPPAYLYIFLCQSCICKPLCAFHLISDPSLTHQENSLCVYKIQRCQSSRDSESFLLPRLIGAAWSQDLPYRFKETPHLRNIWLTYPGTRAHRVPTTDVGAATGGPTRLALGADGLS